MLELKIPPPVYLLLTGGAMWLLDSFLPVTEMIASPWNRLGYIFIILALLTDGTSLVQFFRSHTTMNPVRPGKAKNLVTTGMYQITRNPMYVGLLFLLIGWGFLLGSFSPFLLLPIFIFLITTQQIIPEERILEEKFGQEYRDYKESVNRWF